MSARLCEGCGRPLVGVRRDARFHGSTCRSRQHRRLRREAIVAEKEIADALALTTTGEDALCAVLKRLPDSFFEAVAA